MTCSHDAAEMDTAAHADGMCPLCMAARIEQLEAAFREICDFPYIGAQASAKIWGIARAALVAGKEGT